MPLYRLAVNVIHPAVTGPAVNIWHLRTTDEIEESTADAAMGALKNFYDGLTGILAGGTVCRWLGEMTTVEAEPIVITPGTPWTSTTATTDFACPGATALLMKWRTPQGGASGKGRTFINPIGLSHVNTNGKPNPAALTTATNAGQGLVDWSTAGHGASFGIYSRKNSLLYDITGVSVLGKFAVLTSRRD